jgi:glycosyltransferase involved in cell wall biosynthesis
MPNIVMEAQLAGIPVVATKTGAIVDIVESDKTGILENCGDIAALAKACTDILRNPEQAKKLGHAGRARVQKCFAGDLMVQRYADLIIKR